MTFTSKIESKTSAFWIRQGDPIQVWKNVSQVFPLEAADKTSEGRMSLPLTPGAGPSGQKGDRECRRDCCSNWKDLAKYSFGLFVVPSSLYISEQ